MNQIIQDHIDRLDHAPWLLILPVIVLCVVYGLSMRGRAMRRFASMSMMGFLAPQSSIARRIVKACLFLVAATAVGIALLGPQWGLRKLPAQSRQLDIVLCLDVSRSMLARDAGMKRLDRAKDDIERLLSRLAGGNVGLVTFAGSAELACPLTDDYEFFRLILDEVGIHSAPIGGTNIGNALQAARNALGPRALRDRAIILITDGEDHGTEALDQARAAAKNDIEVYCVGIGDEKRGGRVPIDDRPGQSKYVMHDQQQIWSKLDPARLSAIARAGGGEYYASGQVTDRERTLEWIYSTKLASKVKTDEGDTKIEARDPQFHWFAAVGLALLMLETVIRESRKADALPANIEVSWKDAA